MVWSRTEKRRGRCEEKSDGHGGEGRSRRGRPKTGWNDCISADVRENNWILGWCIIGVTGDDSSKTATPYNKLDNELRKMKNVS